jgi:hypothetical protein
MGLICSIASHRVNRHRVWHDNLNFRTNCERCGTPLLRDQSGWREFDMAIDANASRMPHPRNPGRERA